MGPIGVIRSFGWSLQAWIGALIKDTPYSSLAPSAMGGQSNKQALTRTQTRWYLDLGHPSFQNYEKYITVVYKSSSCGTLL